MTRNLEKIVKMWNNLEKTVKNVKKPGENHQKYQKTSKIPQNAERTVKNVQKSGKNRQNYRKMVKNVEKR